MPEEVAVSTTTQDDRLTITNARLRDQRSLATITVMGGEIQSVTAEAPGPEAVGTVVDAAGGLVTESFIDAHLHLDKVFTLAGLGEQALLEYQTDSMGTTMRAIETASDVKRQQDPEKMLVLARRCLAMASYYGTTHVRAFADVDSKAGTRGVEVLCAARDEFAGLVDVQVVAFPQDGIGREPGAAELMQNAMEAGADVVGGIPWIEYTEAAMVRHVKHAFDLAEAYDADVSMLLDDAGDPGLRTLEAMAVEAIGRGWAGRAMAHHCRAMQLYTDPYFERLAALLREAEVSVVSDPHTGPLHARVRDLMERGVNVILGQDDISDAYYSLGRCNMAEVAFLGCHLLWMMHREGQESLYDAVTVHAAKGVNVAGHRIAPGNPANLVVHCVPDVTEVLRFHAAPVAVVSHGRLVNREQTAQTAGIPTA